MRYIYTKINKAITISLLIVMLVYVLLFNQVVNKVSSQEVSQKGLELLWVKYGPELWPAGTVHATCVSGTTVYVIGDSYFTVGVIETRDANTGKLLDFWAKSYGSFTILYDCLILNDYLYVIGIDNYPGNWEWLILKLTLDLKLVAEKRYNPSPYEDAPYTIASDGKYLYVGGYDSSPMKAFGSIKDIWLFVDTQWHLIKMDPNDLSVIKRYTFNPSNDIDKIYSINVNPINGKIWIAGSVDLAKGRIEVLDENLSLISSLDLETFVAYPKIIFDEIGYSYLATVFSILKISPELKIVKTNYYNITINKITYNNGYLYLAGIICAENRLNNIIVKVTNELEILDELVLNSQNNATVFFADVGKMAIANNVLYVAGHLSTKKEFIWVIYAVRISHLQNMTTTPIITNLTTPSQTSPSSIPSPISLIPLPQTVTVNSNQTDTLTIPYSLIIPISYGYIIFIVVTATTAMTVITLLMLRKSKK
jgi:hypothetical protein